MQLLPSGCGSAKASPARSSGEPKSGAQVEEGAKTKQSDQPPDLSERCHLCAPWKGILQIWWCLLPLTAGGEGARKGAGAGLQKEQKGAGDQTMLGGRELQENRLYFYTPIAAEFSQAASTRKDNEKPNKVSVKEAVVAKKKRKPERRSKVTNNKQNIDLMIIHSNIDGYTSKKESVNAIA